MATQRYSVTPHPIETVLAWVKSGEIAIPEIQRPFVWEATKVRNLLDSLYQGYPVGYLITWRNPTVRLKDGTPSAGKRILIDGQQRVTALMASLLGHEVLTRDYETVRIRIAFHPQEERFEVANPAIRKDAAWIEDVTAVFAPSTSVFQLVTGYCQKNPGVSQDAVFATLEKLRKIINNHVGVIELAHDLDIETVTEIFIRVNSAGTELSQADFAMSKIAVNETCGGNLLRKAIDYFCHMSVAPEFVVHVEKRDQAFAASEFFPAMRWLKDVNNDIYIPSYTDMLRVAFTSEFGRGKLQDLVALLSGRNFETRQFEEAISEASFDKLKKGVLAFINRTHFERITMILRSAGFVTSDLISGRNAVNFAYVLYLRGRAERVPAADLERLVRRWYAMSILSSRYTSSPETAFDFDIRQIAARGLVSYCDGIIESELPDSFWIGMLPQLMNTSSAQSPYFLAYQAAQVKLGDKGFLSRDITVRDLMLNRSDVHHIYPKKHLKGQGLSRGRYNQIANFVLTQSEINIAIGDKPPDQYFVELAEQVHGGRKRYGGITDETELRANLRANCIPESLLDGRIPGYDEFLEERRKLMALKVKAWFEAL
ncbi:DUF262 domain-containing protein [Chloracidobacterium sp. MS 40/45]|uniref:GmrSD restriction endonuclease domain-containing protein n=1 Tax=Chloracidobacterium aggregatum TaxID=2851959 RepID=UPI001B8BE628|nr:DUF262 domain-containing protein [Chloracidobacterium aggregatum]QUW01275.1 DUF262 domain-containing protein [Chloracidobacterium sp. MS 40/45]